MAANTLQDLYIHKLQDLYSAEDQITDALPKMIEKASNPQLRQGFSMHLRQTEQHRTQVEQLLASLGEKAGKETCKGMQGIITENEKVMKMVDDGDALDAAMIAGAQAVEHYEMAGYGTARTWARQLGRGQDARALERILEQEKQTDELLTEVAESMVNPQVTAA